MDMETILDVIGQRLQTDAVKQIRGVFDDN